MLVAIISYILLNLFIARAKAQSGGEVDENSKAEMIAKVSRIIDTINRLVAIWFKFLLWLFIIIFPPYRHRSFCLQGSPTWQCGYSRTRGYGNKNRSIQFTAHLLKVGSFSILNSVF